MIICKHDSQILGCIKIGKNMKINIFYLFDFYNNQIYYLINQYSKFIIMKKTILKIVSCFLLVGIYSCGNNTNPPTPTISCRLLKLDGSYLYYDSNNQLVKVTQPNYTVYYTYLNNTIKEKYVDGSDPDSLEVIHTLNSNGVVDNTTISYSTFGNYFSPNTSYLYDNNNYLTKVIKTYSTGTITIEFTYNNSNITFVKQTDVVSGNTQVSDFQIVNYNNYLNRANFSDYIVKGHFISSFYLCTTNLFGKSVINAVKTTECCGINYTYTVDSDSSILNGTGGDISEFSRVCD